MKTAIIYCSETGFTQKNAQWLQEALGEDAKLFTLKEARKESASSWKEFDAVVFGGWFHAGIIKGLTWFKKNIPGWSAEGKKLAVWGTGASPAGTPDIQLNLKNNLSDEEHKVCKIFYCPGGFAYEKMSRANKFLMRLFAKAMADRAKKDPSYNEMAAMITQSYDLSDKKYVEPIVEYLRK